MNPNRNPYFGKSAVLATQHAKGQVIAPEFKSILDLQIEELGVDTDSLGTFTGEIERVGSAKDTVLAKARLGMAKSGNPRGLASEGSIGADPLIPFINSDIELIAFIDDEIGFQLVESIRSTEIIAATAKVTPNSGLEEFFRRADFPNHKLIIRSTDQPVSFSVKGIDSHQMLEKSLKEAFKDFPELIVESDLRAHCSPSRMENIRLVARKLALRLKCLCPECDAPGWGVVRVVRGLPCSECGEISEEKVRAEVFGCVKCQYEEEGRPLAGSIDPGNCNLCNP